MTGIKLLILTLASVFISTKYNMIDDIKHHFGEYALPITTGTFTFLSMELPDWISSSPYYSNVLEYGIRTFSTLATALLTTTAIFFFKKLLNKYFPNNEKDND